MNVENQSELVAELFSRLSSENQRKYLNFMRLLVSSPDFQYAFRAVIPPGEDAPLWNVTMAFVDEWMEKACLGGAV